jgi:hypothetical protein
MYHAWERLTKRKILWWENLKEKDHSEDLGRDGRIILEWISGKQDENMWTGFIWLRIRTS